MSEALSVQGNNTALTREEQIIHTLPDLELQHGFMALNLVSYSDSESPSDSETGRAPAKKARKEDKQGPLISPKPRSAASSSATDKLPPLPSRFHDLYATAPRLAARDDPSLHGGRQRTVPHEVGNWPSFVFLEWHLNTTEFSTLSDIVGQCQIIVTKHERQRLGICSNGDGQAEVKEGYHGKRKSRHIVEGDMQSSTFRLTSSLVSDLGAEQPLHLSLSRPNILKTDERVTFVDLLEGRIKKAKLKPFDVTFTGFEWVGNFDNTRWFFVMKAVSKASELSTLLRLTNLTFATYGQPALYSQDKADSGFHVTIGWSLETPDQELRGEMVNEMNRRFGEVLASMTMKVEEVKIKIGNIVKVLRLGG